MYISCIPRCIAEPQVFTQERQARTVARASCDTGGLSGFSRPRRRAKYSSFSCAGTAVLLAWSSSASGVSSTIPTERIFRSLFPAPAKITTSLLATISANSWQIPSYRYCSSLISKSAGACREGAYWVSTVKPRARKSLTNSVGYSLRRGTMRTSVIKSNHQFDDSGTVGFSPRAN